MHLLLEAEFVDDPLVIYLTNSKEASVKACEIWLKLGLLKDMATFQTLQTLIGHNATCYQLERITKRVTTRITVYFL